MIFFNHQTEVTANTILRGVFYGNLLAIGQYAKLNAHQSMFVAICK